MKTTYLDVQALGTVFTVASYPADSCTSTILEEGSVKVDVRAGEHQPAILKPNERLVYSHAAHTVTVRPVDALLYKMERSGYLIYENVSFSHLMASLERKFNVTIHYNSQKYADEYYNVKFAPHETLEGCAWLFCSSCIGIRFKIKGKCCIYKLKREERNRMNKRKPEERKCENPSFRRLKPNCDFLGLNVKTLKIINIQFSNIQIYEIN